MQVRNTNYYADQISARYPLLPQPVVRDLCQWMMRRLFALVSTGEEVLLQSNPHGVRLKIYHRDMYTQRANERNRRKRWPLVQQREQRAAAARQRRYCAHFARPHTQHAADSEQA